MTRKYPRINEIIKSDVYVDDCNSGTRTIDVFGDGQFEGLETVGFTLKGFMFSGRMPDGKISGNGKSIHVRGLKWFSKKDELCASMNDLSFAERIRGRKDEVSKRVIPKDLTKRDCISKVAECFSPTGILLPLISGMKLDCSELHARVWTGMIRYQIT